MSTSVDGKVVNIPIKHVGSDTVRFSNPPGELPKFGTFERQVGYMEVTIPEGGTPYAAKLSLNCQNFLPKAF
ncbi:MAG TPA: hypothetical protein VGJ20_36730 [Xanthobacteraceae bacterium]